MTTRFLSGAILWVAACQTNKDSHTVTISPTLPPEIMAKRDAGWASDNPTREALPASGAQDPPRVTSTCPEGMAAIPIGGCIDRYEASAGPGQLGGIDAKDTTLIAQSAAGRTPIDDVSAAQARKICINAGKRLCTEREWRSACKDRTGWERIDVHSYAYGHGYQAGLCRDYSSSEQGRTGVALSGSFSRCVTPSGVYDMSGNVGEIIDQINRRGGYDVRGGTYNNSSLDTSCDEDDDSLPKDEHRKSVGVRCCSAGMEPAAKPKM